MFNLLEKDILPDFLIRLGIRNLLKARLEEEKKENLEEQQKHLNQYIEDLKKSPIAINTADANEQHYEVPTEFYKFVLGKRMKYSGGYWPLGAYTLDESEESMLKLSCERAQLKDGLSLLDLGCGWGSVSLYVAEHFPKCKITAVSNSKTQKEYIDSVAKEKGFKNLTVITRDMNEFTIDEKFDRIISVEMLEHMKNYQKLFAKLSSFLKPDGLFFIHIFTHKQYAYHFEVRDETDWMAKYFFTGGMMPSHNLFLYFQENLNIVNHWVVNGTHYGKTSEAWLANMDKHKSSILPILEKTYGKENVTKWWSYWRIFFLACAELFSYRKGEEWIVSHYLFRKK
ncbi:MAG TPA: cyclopropane-fatty-acyl-phospholipid synthase family protein [Leptospiraceae bacterium]|nr:cyclopropane-fatty-acyl-phospholipid synthase family protein [Leptospiraceae bacterium]HMW03698.1 cyclopropane-fatty-acyl-phospholipid synthase family protein [Leptospiraceae bacterium]HMX35384.1 cyclopropane-fatty-acyl-phospholipid synthase family protein [Leptospiraceae bacterium]HMY29678.1 cyclopropane-fatty-acyl-phospholipid synthase family protein [Leptospiraceae bacterium]HMZ64046.1 cyclopropane-fatty-acyl-phospholipid synthase family protein [Leptospiraceae bacterium]